MLYRSAMCRGREVLAYIEGRDPGWPFIPEILSAEGANHLGELARRLRAALRSYQCPSSARWQFAASAPAPGEAMQHGDLGPWNLLWSDDGQIAGVLDWDFAQPGEPWYDTGHLAWSTVPLMDDDRARARGFPKQPDRLMRLDAFAEGAGVSRAHLLKVALAAQLEYERRVVARRASRGVVGGVLRAGIPPQRGSGSSMDNRPVQPELRRSGRGG
jgi:hypothetical protein